MMTQRCASWADDDVPSSSIGRGMTSTIQTFGNQINNYLHDNLIFAHVVKKYPFILNPDVQYSVRKSPLL
jgi:hypothetical protein